MLLTGEAITAEQAQAIGPASHKCAGESIARTHCIHRAHFKSRHLEEIRSRKTDRWLGSSSHYQLSDFAIGHRIGPGPLSPDEIFRRQAENPLGLARINNERIQQAASPGKAFPHGRRIEHHGNLQAIGKLDDGLGRGHGDLELNQNCGGPGDLWSNPAEGVSGPFSVRTCRDYNHVFGIISHRDKSSPSEGLASPHDAGYIDALGYEMFAVGASVIIISDAAY